MTRLPKRPAPAAMLCGASALALAVLSAAPAAAGPVRDLAGHRAHAQADGAGGGLVGEDAVQSVLDDINGFNPDIRAFILKQEGALEDAKQQIRDFQTDMGARITPALVDAANRDDPRIARLQREAERSAANLQDYIDGVRVHTIMDAGRQDAAYSRYVKAVYQQEKLRQLARLYPDSDVIGAANSAANDKLAAVGDFDDVQSAVEAQAAQKIADERLYPARQHDAALEQSFVEAFRASPFTRDDFAGAEILAIHLTDTGWTVTRNEVTGVILHRDQQGHIALRNPDGKCWSYLGLFQQDHVGDGYGASRLRSGSRQEMLCENVPA